MGEGTGSGREESGITLLPVPVSPGQEAARRSPSLEELMRDAPSVARPSARSNLVIEEKAPPAPRPKPQPKKASPAKGAVKTRRRGRFLRDLGIGAALVLLVHAFIVQVSVVRGLSMAPSLRDGDRLMVDRISYAMSEVERFDVVVLRYPKNPKVDFVKRIIGLPGDRVELQNGQLYVNGEKAPEGFGHVEDRYARGSWVVPDERFFVLGDNRPVSCDSREFGMVDRALLKGKVRVVFWPPSRFTLF